MEERRGLSCLLSLHLLDALTGNRAVKEDIVLLLVEKLLQKEGFLDSDVNEKLSEKGKQN